MSPRHRRPMDREDVLDAIEDALDDGAPEDAIALCDGMLERDPQDPDVLVLRGQALADIGELEEALEHYEAAHELCPDWEDAEIMRASVLLELARLDEAAGLAEEVLSRDPRRADAYRTLAIVSELRGNELGAERYYRKANALDPSLPLPYRISSERFLEVALERLAAFPPEVRELLHNVDIRVRDVPRPEDVVRERSAGDRGPLSMLVLGYFEGTPLSMRTLEDPLCDMPCLVSLFKKNHERISTSLEELAEQVDITLKHELGHFLGLEEEDMERLGLE